MEGINTEADREMSEGTVVDDVVEPPIVVDQPEINIYHWVAV